MDGAHVIYLEGRITKDDYIRAQKLHYKTRPLFKGLGIVIVAIVTFAYLLTLQSLVKGDSLDSLDWFFLSSLPSFLIYWILVRPRLIGRNYDKQPGFQDGFQYSFTDAGIESKTDRLKGSTPWDHFIKWREGKHTFLIYLSPSMFQIVPKRLIPDNHTQRLRELLMQKLGPENISRLKGK